MIYKFLSKNPSSGDIIGKSPPKKILIFRLNPILKNLTLKFLIFSLFCGLSIDIKKKEKKWGSPA